MPRYLLLVIVLLAFWNGPATSGDEPFWETSVGGPIFDLALSPNGHELAYGGESGLLGIVDIASRTKRSIGSDRYNPNSHIRGVGFFAHSQGDVLAAGSNDTTVCFFRATNGSFLSQATASSHLTLEMMKKKISYFPVTHLAVAPDGECLAYTGTSGKGPHFFVWTKATQKNTSVCTDIFLVNQVVILSGHIVVGGRWGQVYRREDLKAISRFPAWHLGRDVAAGIDCFSNGPAELLVAIGTGEGNLSVRAINTAVAPIDPLMFDHLPIVDPANAKFSPRAAAKESPINEGKVKMVFKAPGAQQAHENGLEDVAFSSDGKYLASAGSDLVVGNALMLFDGTQHPNRYRRRTPGKNYVRVWEVATGRMVAEWGVAGEKNSAAAIVFSKDDKAVYAGFEDGNIRAWSVPSSTLSMP